MFKELGTLAVPLEEFEGIEVVEQNVKIKELIETIKATDKELKSIIRENISTLYTEETKVKLLAGGKIAHNLRGKVYKLGKQLIEEHKELEKDKIVLEDMRLEDLRLKIKEVKENLGYSTHIPLYKMKKEDMIEWLRVAIWEELSIEKPTEDDLKKYLSK